MSDDNDLMQRIALAGARMDPGLSDRDVERLVVGAARRRRLRPLKRAAYVTTSSLALALAVFAFLPHAPVSVVKNTGTGHAKPALVDSFRVLRLHDGSTATALDSGTELSLDEETHDRARLSLSRGRGRFEVTPRASRTFVVNAGDVTVKVLGTLFTVERIADRVGIDVESGTVRVEWPGGAAILQEGSTGWFPPLPAAAVAPTPAAPVHTKRPASTKPNRIVASAPTPAVETPAPVLAKAESAGDLLSAADNARLDGNAERAASLLRKLLNEHRNDARAALAAFTLGRILLMELSRPLEAAAAFAEARRLSPHGPLAEDSLAREVESLKKAGEPTLAKARAQDYLRLYPNGRRVPSVRMMSDTK